MSSVVPSHQGQLPVTPITPSVPNQLLALEEKIQQIKQQKEKYVALEVVLLKAVSSVTSRNTTITHSRQSSTL